LTFAAKPIIAAADGAMAGLIIIAMTFGLIDPKMCIEHFFRIQRKPDRIADEAADQLLCGPETGDRSDQDCGRSKATS
jgi:hypothetical protein